MFRHIIAYPICCVLIFIHDNIEIPIWLDAKLVNFGVSLIVWATQNENEGEE